MGIENDHGLENEEKQMGGMDYREMQAVAKKIASVLDKHEATVRDVSLIFETAQKYMVVKKNTMIKDFVSW